MIGQTLNHYRVLRSLGSGGMGEVYLADDTRLKRQVAIKILPASLAAQPDRHERFEREAQAVAALNHPNIVTVHSVEQAGETHFLTMEYVDGRTLADLLPKGGLPLKRLLVIARQIVDAVVAAHDHGIIHRDLKPANVMVATNDRVKVLDFGLAKLREEAAVAESLPTRELTGEGKIVGTVAYMSPEQAEGKPVDARSDIFSLGVMLFETATGDRPFKGDTSLSVLSAILKDTPRTLTEVNPALPRDLERVVRHCLVKDPERRYQSAKDLRTDLEELEHSIDSGQLSAVPRTAAPRRRGAGIAAAVLGIAAIAFVGVLWLRRAAAPPQTPPTATFTRLTQLAGLESFASISPDGKWFVYVSSAAGNPDIYLQSVGGQTPINLTKDSPLADTMPAFSPDGDSIAFRSSRDGGGIFVMGRTGESVRRLTTRGFFPAWFSDSKHIVFSDEIANGMPENRGRFSELWTTSTTGGEPRSLGIGDAVQPHVSPHNRRIAYWGLSADSKKRFTTGNRDMWTANADGTKPVRVTDDEATDWNPVWSPDGRWLYFLSNRAGSMNLWRIAIDETTGAVNGLPQPITTPAPYVAHFSLSADGRVGTYSAVASLRNLAKVSFDVRAGTTSGPIEAVTTGTTEIAVTDVSSDGGLMIGVAYTSQRLQEDLYVIAADGSRARQLMNDAARDRYPRWSADGKHVFFYSNRSGPYEIWSIDPDGGSLRQLTNSGDRMYPLPSRDGTRLAALESASNQLLVYDPRDFAKPPEQLSLFPVKVDGTLMPLDWSPDGKQLLLGAVGTVWIYSTESRSYRRIGNGSNARYLGDGQRLILQRDGAIAIVEVAREASREILRIPGETLDFPWLANNESRLFFTRRSSEADVWLVRFGDTDDGRRTP